jgi:hypothetical protein
MVFQQLRAVEKAAYRSQMIGDKSISKLDIRNNQVDGQRLNNELRKCG